MRRLKLLHVATAVVLTISSFAAINCVAQDSPDSTPKKEPETCTVQGTVLAAATGEPLKSALVVLVDREHNDPPEGFTDAQGRFKITSVPAGSYHFRASKLGYVEQAYHPDGPAGTAEILNLEPGQKLDKVVFRLTRAATIIGRVTDELGEPVAGAEVWR